MKKRLTALLLVLVLVMSACSSIFATAKLSADKTAIKAGEQVVVTLTNETELSGITNLDYSIFFDDTLFELTGSSKKGCVKGMPVDEEEDPISFQISNKLTRNGKACYAVNLVDSTSEGLTIAAGPIYNLTFTAKTDITEGQNADFILELYSVMDTTFAYGDNVDPALKELVKVTEPKVSISVTPESSYEGYAVSIAEDQNKVVGETAIVTITIDSEEEKTFNAVDMTFSYDAEKLTLAETTMEGFTVKAANGTVRIQGYGEDRTIGQTLSLSFTATDAGDAKVEIKSAKVDKSAHAIANDAPEAKLLNDSVTIHIGGYPVTLSDDFTGADTAAPGEDYTFTANDPNYDYTIIATMGGEDVEVIDNGDGSYTIIGVSGELIITDTKTPKSFDVTVQGDDADKVEAGSTATYLTDFSFTLPEGLEATDTVDGYSYTVSVTIGGQEFTGYTADGRTYTIPGASITGPIVITVTKNVIEAGYVSVEINGEDATGEDKAAKNEDYTFSVDKKEGYDYVISATMNGETVEVIDNGDGTFTIKNVTGPIVINVTKTAQNSVEVYEYVKLDGKTMYLVTVTGTVESGKNYAYDGNAMFISQKYNEGKDTFCYLVISEKTLEEVKTEAAGKVALMSVSAETISYDGDVNGTAVVDINDAQLTYDMYNAKYDNFTSVSMIKFLRADMNASKNLNTEDAVAIVALIQ